ncbi:spindle pole body component 110-like [Aphidius gifuensis]|uniref:spindle pole body component 110-like n=1 Tax=Aphidius gifuensis TaxID=684658 RepID=UPI001CDD0B66|nr:spindle pole body component 110-like [Aphidius gifuensis]
MENVGDNGDKKNEQNVKKNEGNIDCSSHAKRFRCCPPDFCDMIEKRQEKLLQLSKIKNDLSKRVELQSRIYPVATLIDLKPGENVPAKITNLIGKQSNEMQIFNSCINNSLSQHNDIRIREIESTRKKSLKRRDEAKCCLLKKKLTIDENLKKINDAKEKKLNLEKKINEIENILKKNDEDDDKKNDINNEQSVQSLGIDDLNYLTKFEELVKNELTTKKQIDELESRQEANMRALEFAVEIMSQEKNNEVDNLKGILQNKSSANQLLANDVCNLEDEVERLQIKLTQCNQKLLQYTNKNKTDTAVGERINYEDKQSMIKPNVTEVEVLSRIPDTKDQNIDAIVSVKSTGTNVENKQFKEVEVLAKIIETKDQNIDAIVSVTSTGTDAINETFSKSIHDISTETDNANINQIVDKNSIEKKVITSVVDESIENSSNDTNDVSQDVVRAADSENEFHDLLEDNTNNQLQITDYNYQSSLAVEQTTNNSGEKFIDLPEDNLNSQLQTTDYNYQTLPSVAEPQFFDLPEDKTETHLQTTDYNFQSTIVEPSETEISSQNITTFDTDKIKNNNFIQIDRDELKNWLNNIAKIQARVSKCQQCVELETDCVNLQKSIAHHLGMELEDFLDSHSKIRADELAEGQNDYQLSIPPVIPQASDKIIKQQTDKIDDIVIGAGKTSVVLSPAQTISFSVETSTPMPVSKPVIEKNKRKKTIEPIIEDESNKNSSLFVDTSLVRRGQQSGRVSTPTHSIKLPIKSSTPLIKNTKQKEKKHINIDSVINEDSNSSSDDEINENMIVKTIYDNSRNTSSESDLKESHSDIGNVDDNADSIGEPSRRQESHENKKARHKNDGSKIPTNDKTNGHSGKKISVKNKEYHESDESINDRTSKLSECSKNSNCLCQQTWLTMSKKDYEKFKNESMKSQKSKKPRNEYFSKTISTSLTTPVETQTNINNVPNFNCNPCSCNPCGGSDCSITDNFDNEKKKKLPQKKSQGVLAILPKSKR